MTQPTLTFRWRLPFAVILLCYLALASMVTLAYFHLRSGSGPRGVRVTTAVGSYVIPRDKQLKASLVGMSYLASHTIQALNLPGMLGELASSMFMRTWPDRWRPRYLGGDPGLPFDGSFSGLFAWRAMIFPLYCLPFWWFAGLGIDALRGKLRLHWAVLLLGTLFTIGFAVIFAGVLTQAISEHDRSLLYVFVGLLLWTALMSVFPILWSRRLRSTRRARQTA